MEISPLQANPTNKSYESYLAWKDGKTMLFRKPPTARRLETLLSVAVAVQLVLGPLVGAVLTGKAYLAALSVLGAGWLLYFLYYVSGPADIRLDGERRTYERTTGWPWKPVTRTGSFADIRGVCVSPQNNVIILMTKPRWTSKGVIVSNPAMSSAGSSALLIDRSHIAASRALAEELCREYGFPLVPYPKK